VEVCPNCGRRNAPDARFCSGCGTLLESGGARREERKIVTVLFCDLVGSTSRAETADPEDVRAFLSGYHERVRNELERFGGTVEKFIGDAVMALFGAPVAHEDDPERAVRAALAIRDWAQDDGDVQVRIGVTTGEALVVLGARPGEGEAMAAGDVVNTAARLQAAAPENAILVDETTYRASERVVEYAAGAAIEAKGKAAPVATWQALEARSRFGVDVRQIAATPLVGRQREYTLLTEMLARVKDERSPQLVTLVGVPGIGKSRLVWELFQHIRGGSDLITWRQGRSLPYGEGAAFWALGEVVKAQAGILETDTAADARAKLAQAVEALVVDARDAAWVDRHLRALVGLDTSDSGSERGEAFAAWRRFVEALAETRPLVVVFEDLHFADEGLLDFVDYLVEWATGVPLLVVGTARPELLTRRPAWGGGKSNAVTISLSPLSDDETAQLVHSLLERPVVGADLQRTLLDRAGGNPLYAEEFARLVAAGREPAELPETVQGVVAARLDLLEPDEKRLLQDAAVVGKVFWLGTVAAMGASDRSTLERQLHALERKEFVRRERAPSVAGEVEYAFRHILVRDVAYGQIPRQQRIGKHAAAASWIESLGRPDDHAELLAHHYLAALELAAATGADTSAFVDRARSALRNAGERALAVHAPPAAVRFFETALELWPHDDERPELLFGFGRALMLARDERAAGALEQARDALAAAGASGRAAEAAAVLAELWWHQARPQRSEAALDVARELIVAQPASASKASVLAQIARYKGLAGETEEATRAGREAVAMAASLGLDDVLVNALTSLGTARVLTGDVGGFDDLERAVAIGETINSPHVARAYNNLGTTLADFGETERSRALLRNAVESAERFGNPAMARFSGAILAWDDYEGGDWDTYISYAHRFLSESERRGGSYQDAYFRSTLAVIEAARGNDARAREEAAHAVELARALGEPQVVLPALASAAVVATETGQLDRAKEYVQEWLDGSTRHRLAPRTGSGMAALMVALLADRLGITAELRALTEAAAARDRWAEVARAAVDGDYLTAAELAAAIQHRPLEARARLRAAEALLASGDRASADAQLARSLAFWRAVAARRYIREGERLLAATA
jgi:class 3 adenylate cyclase